MITINKTVLWLLTNFAIYLIEKDYSLMRFNFNSYKNYNLFHLNFSWNFFKSNNTYYGPVVTCFANVKLKCIWLKCKWQLSLNIIHCIAVIYISHFKSEKLLGMTELCKRDKSIFFNILYGKFIDKISHVSTTSLFLLTSTTYGQFHQHYTCSFFEQKFCARLCPTNILGMYFLGARMSTQSLLLKCWWIWHLELQKSGPKVTQIDCTGMMLKIWTKKLTISNSRISRSFHE